MLLAVATTAAVSKVVAVKADPWPFNWFDAAVVVLLIIGIFRGRKHGMSEELLLVLEWLLIVVVGAFAYRPLGALLQHNAPFFSLLGSYITVYVLIAFAIHLILSKLKTAMGDKLVGSDLFGRSEYYLGMLAGMLRFACIIIFVMSLFHARLVTEKERAETEKIQAKNFEGIRFPTYGEVQHDVLFVSLTGKFVQAHLKDFLIATVEGDTSPAAKITPYGQRRDAADEVFGPSKK